MTDIHGIRLLQAELSASFINIIQGLPGEKSSFWNSNLFRHKRNFLKRLLRFHFGRTYREPWRAAIEEDCWREKEEEEANLTGRWDRKDHELRANMGSVWVSTLPPHTSCSFCRKEQQETTPPQPGVTALGLIRSCRHRTHQGSEEENDAFHPTVVTAASGQQG